MKPLIETNPYLKDKDYRESSNSRSTRTSCGVEGIIVRTSSGKIKVDSSRTRKGLEKIKARLNRSGSFK